MSDFLSKNRVRYPPVSHLADTKEHCLKETDAANGSNIELCHTILTYLYEAYLIDTPDFISEDTSYLCHGKHGMMR